VPFGISKKRAPFDSRFQAHPPRFYLRESVRPILPRVAAASSLNVRHFAEGAA
jgi:hypothetical protein